MILINQIAREKKEPAPVGSFRLAQSWMSSVARGTNQNESNSLT